LLILTTIRRLALLLFVFGVGVFGVWAPAAYAWSWPVQGPVVQPFSYDEAHPYASGQHRGVDIGADAAGEPVVAPAAGTVSFAGTVPTNGKSVTIETADGYSVTLTHLGSIGVAKGATVAEQDPIGAVGPSGTPEVDGPYVHLGIRLTADPNGYVDPLGLLPPASGGAATDTGTAASQPASSGASPAVPAGRPAPSARSAPAATTPRARPAGRSHARPHPQERAQKTQSRARASRSPHRHAVRDLASDQTDSSRRPVAPRLIGPDLGHASRPSVYVASPSHEPSSPVPTLVCNWAAALFALGAVFAARRQRSRARATASAEVLRLPPPEAGLRQVSRAA
jgi:MYXO-CTERM domain-containing protein